MGGTLAGGTQAIKVLIYIMGGTLAVSFHIGTLAGGTLAGILFFFTLACWPMLACWPVARWPHRIFFTVGTLAVSFHVSMLAGSTLATKVFVKSQVARWPVARWPLVPSRRWHAGHTGV